jgi:hypothetical protein
VEKKTNSEPLIFGYRHCISKENRLKFSGDYVKQYLKPNVAHAMTKMIMDKVSLIETQENHTINYSVELVLLTPEKYQELKDYESLYKRLNLSKRNSVICPGAKDCNQVDPATGTDYKLSGGCRHFMPHQEDCTCHTACAGYHCTKEVSQNA